MFWRWLGRLLIAFAIAAIAWDLYAAIAGGPLRLSATGALWFQLDSSGLNASQAFVQRYLLPEIWDPVIQTWLSWPAVWGFGVPGLLLLILFRNRGRRIFLR